MVTERSGDKATEMRRAYKQFMTDYCTTITINNLSFTVDGMGRRTAQTTSATTDVKASIQWVSKADLSRINAGDVQIGDGMLFILHDQSLNINDEVVYNSVTYRVVSQIEGEVVNGKVVYLGFIIRKNQQS